MFLLLVKSCPTWYNDYESSRYTIVVYWSNEAGVGSHVEPKKKNLSEGSNLIFYICYYAQN